MTGNIMSLEKLTESEEVVMKAVWDCEKDPELSDVLEIVTTVYGKDWKPQTVSVFLSHLVRKEYLQLIRHGKKFTYKTLLKESVYRRKLYRQHISFWNHNDINEFVDEMIKNKDLTSEDIEAALKM